jgi:putative photosynthetic complex assembly protein 2
VSAVFLAFAYTVFAWWFSTGVILHLVGRHRSTFSWTMLGASVVLLFALTGLYASRDTTTVASAYCGFTCALLVWAWQEVAFLLGIVTGPRRIACEPDARGWRRTWHAFQTVQHHELGLVLLGIAVFACTWGGANQTGWWTFVILWTMRQSAKLNIFLGARNLNENFLPAHLKYLGSYFRKHWMNPLFPISVTVSTLIAVPLWQAALAPTASPFEATSAALNAVLLSLAIAEHWFLVLPLPFDKLWQWGLRSRDVPGSSSVEFVTAPVRERP